MLLTDAIKLAPKKQEIRTVQGDENNWLSSYLLAL